MDLQIGNRHGIAAVGNKTLLATVTADGANTVTVDDISRLRVGDVIDIITRADGTVIADARTITGITSAGVVTYSGANVTASAADSIYYDATVASRSSQNGGTSTDRGLKIANLGDHAEMRARLKVIDSTYYTDARINNMTENDAIYAIRLNQESASVR